MLTIIPLSAVFDQLNGLHRLSNISVNIFQGIAYFAFVKPGVWIRKQIFQCLFKVFGIRKLDIVRCNTYTRMALN